jgi:hypothetical protein
MAGVAGLGAMADNLLARNAGLGAVADAIFARDGGLHPPSEVIMKWPKPNRVDPEERGWEAPIALIVILVITFVVYALRMWARLVVARNAGVDDLLMSLAMIPLIGLTISVVLGGYSSSLVMTNAQCSQLSGYTASNGMPGTRLIRLMLLLER